MIRSWEAAIDREVFLNDDRTQRDGRDRGVATKRVIAETGREGIALSHRLDRSKIHLLERGRVRGDTMQECQWPASVRLEDIDGRCNFIERRHTGRQHCR